MNSPGSVTHLFQDLRSPDESVRESAAQEIWVRFSQQLLELARNRLSGAIKVREDENDVVQSMYKSICARLERGQYTFANRDDMIDLMVTVTLNKVRDAVRRHQREGRDVGREQTGQMAAGQSGSMVDLVNLLPGPEPTASHAAMFTETVEEMCGLLPDKMIRDILMLKLEGYNNREIAEKLGCAERTVERKLDLLKDKWRQSQAEKQ